MTKTSEAHRGGGSSLPGTSMVSVWCLDQQKHFLLASVSPQRPVTPEDCPPRVSALHFSHMTLSHFSSLAFKQNIGYVCLLNREMKASHLGAGVPAPAVCEEHSDCVSCSLWRLLCSPLWGAGWQSWRHVFGLVSRSAHLKVLGLLALRVLILLFVVLVYIYSLLFTWSLPTTVLLYLSFSLWSLTLASLFSFYN